MIVIDASAILELLLNSPASGRVAERLFARNDTLHAPHLLDLEVAQILRRYTLAGEMEAERSEQALEDLADLRLNRYPHDVFLFRIWALRCNLTAYDAAYIALAEALDAPLVTRDTGRRSRKSTRTPTPVSSPNARPLAYRGSIAARRRQE